VKRYMSGSGEYVFVFPHDLVHLLLLCGEDMFRGHGCDHDLLFTLRANHKEDKFIVLGDDLPALLSRDQVNGGRMSYLWYPIQLSTQSNNKTVSFRLIYNMVFPQVRLA
jgi:hypothetical protein